MDKMTFLAAAVLCMGSFLVAGCARSTLPMGFSKE